MIGLLLIAAVYVCILVVQRQQELKETTRYNVVWPTSQANTEFARLEQRISALVGPPAVIDKDEIELRLDIVINRYRVLQSRDVQDFVRSDPVNGDILSELGAVVGQARALIEQIEQPGVPEKLMGLLQPVGGKLARLAAAANQWDSERVTDGQHQLIRLYWLFSGMAAALAFCGVVLILILNVQNRWLRTAHVQLQSLTGDLQAATVELGNANRAVKQANTELVAQNAALIDRDHALRTQNQRFDAALNNMSQALCMVDSDQRLIVCNERFLALFDLDPHLARPGTSLSDIARSAGARGGAAVPALAQIVGQPLPPVAAGASQYHRELGDGRTLAVSYQPMGSEGWVATYEDITERRRAEARIAHMAHHDSLTDLPNRLLFQHTIEAAMARLHQRQQPFAVLCLDLDRFKSVNDTLGHAVGDALLKAVADRLRASLREGDMVARLGGDEFAVLQLDADQPRSADNLAKRITELVGRPYDLDGHRVLVSTSIGVAVAPGDGTSSEALLRNADIALYRVKSEGRNGFRFFEREMDVQLQARFQLEEDLRTALDAGQFRLYFQPLVDVATGRISGCEALLRWRHPERGMVAPVDFIRVTEETGLIIPLGEWVLEEACRQAASWPVAIPVAVNLSPVQFTDRHLVEAVQGALQRSGLPPARLELEITESVLLREDDSTLAMLHELRRLGVAVALDDFGTGYSSLSYLRSFPFDNIKVDQVFVRDIAERADCQAIVKSVISLGRSLGMTTTAEGVETEEQVSYLQSMGCDQAQGYFYSRPLPPEALATLLAENRPLRAPAARSAAG
ncbi:MAG: putative bifunctional diguanylate cyclase/phosphodiesterase [Xanthobacteraceae bacterium]